MSHQATTCYNLIGNKANSNATIQGASGFFGVVATLATDAASIPMIYARLWNEIRTVYNQPSIHTDDALKVIGNILPEVLTDVLFDKVLGNVPVVGIYFNAICAKQMTWRLGTLFALLASRGEDISYIKCKEAMIVIRHLFPQKDMFTFTTPDYHTFIKLIDSVERCSIESFNQKIDKALAVFCDNY
ncbi:MAG: hypothetical protein Q4A69_04840 [Moraxella sp.]|nr:hypothetical protein [Moraxella sp.]